MDAKRKVAAVNEVLEKKFGVSAAAPVAMATAAVVAPAEEKTSAIFGKAKLTKRKRTTKEATNKRIG